MFGCFWDGNRWIPFIIVCSGTLSRWLRSQLRAGGHGQSSCLVAEKSFTFETFVSETPWYHEEKIAQHNVFLYSWRTCDIDHQNISYTKQENEEANGFWDQNGKSGEWICQERTAQHLARGATPCSTHCPDAHARYVPWQLKPNHFEILSFCGLDWRGWYLAGTVRRSCFLPLGTFESCLNCFLRDILRHLEVPASVRGSGRHPKGCSAWRERQRVHGQGTRSSISTYTAQIIWPKFGCRILQGHPSCWQNCTDPRRSLVITYYKYWFNRVSGCTFQH